MNTAIETILKEIEKKGSLHDSAIKEASARQEVLAKPTGALGTLEEISIKLAASPERSKTMLPAKLSL